MNISSKVQQANISESMNQCYKNALQTNISVCVIKICPGKYLFVYVNPANHLLASLLGPLPRRSSSRQNVQGQSEMHNTLKVSLLAQPNT